MSTSKKYFQQYFDKLQKGVPLNELYQELYKLEKEENYDACAGILKAIKKFSK